MTITKLGSFCQIAALEFDGFAWQAAQAALENLRY
jgi:hypothetical protein